MNLIALCFLLAIQIAVSLAGSRDSSGLHHSDEWEGWGGSVFNNRWASANKHISSSSIKNIAVHCQIPHAGGVSATPSLHDGVAFYPTWGGSFVALDYENCGVKWEINVTSTIINFRAPTAFQVALSKAPYTGGMFSSRTSAQIDKENNVLYFGTQLHALMVAVDLTNGALLGLTQINTHEAAVVTQSPTLYENILYTGTSSVEELVAGVIPGYKCCSFVGNAMALRFDRGTGRFTTVWNLSMLPPDHPAAGKNDNSSSSWSGIGIWGSQPAIDPGRRHVFYATGNVYTVPDGYLNCTDEKYSPSTTQNASCLPERVWQNAVLALDLLTGDVAWIKRFGPLDVWVIACGVTGVVTDPVSCPGTPGPDYDFGMAPAFVPGKGKKGQDVVTLGQKSGFLFSLAADTGDVQWSVATSPGGSLGGLSWGVAVDDQRIYFTGINAVNKPWRLQPANNTVVTNSVFGAASLADGKLLWEVPARNNDSAYTPPTAVGDIVLVGRVKPSGPVSSTDGVLVVLGKEDGKVLLEYPLNGTTFHGGVAVQDQYIVFGTGYRGSNGFLYVLKVEKCRSKA
jgi:glucose dehydrogenase